MENNLDHIGPAIYRYLCGTAEDTDHRQIHKWISQDRSRLDTLEEFRQTWELSKGSVAHQDVDAAWQHLRQRIDPDESMPVLTTRARRNPRTRHEPNATRPAISRGRHRWNTWTSTIRIAIILALISGGLLVANHFEVLTVPEPSEPPETTQTYTTPKGQRALINLTDGTQVRLNVGSTLTVSAAFGQSERTVHLNGEAYFEVAHDEDRPFRVHTAQGDVQVLGTAFNVRAYEDEAETRIVVASGTVSVRHRSETKASVVPDSVQLNARDMAVIAEERFQQIRRDVDIGRYVGWTEGLLVFTNANFDEVVRRLEQWYDLEIDVVLPSEAVSTFNGSFKDESLSEILKTVAVTLNLRYDRNRRHITFYRATTTYDRIE